MTVVVDVNYARSIWRDAKKVPGDFLRLWRVKCSKVLRLSN